MERQGSLELVWTSSLRVGEYYSSFVPSEAVSCPCSKCLQTQEHILAMCPTFESKSSEDLVIMDILGMEKGIEALYEFLQATDAFKKLRRSDPSHTNLHPSSSPE
ncbi:hypothetical protein F5141DRAFT_1012528 [Pisolithus sp. B1]|nr:hypothetical protein F5141DRAFT_1012528 [Pisolithus sp. B1]